MSKNYKLLAAITYLEKVGMMIPDDMTSEEIIDWAEQAQDNDQWAQNQGYDDIENWAESTGHACYVSGYDEYTEHGRPC